MADMATPVVATVMAVPIHKQQPAQAASTMDAHAFEEAMHQFDMVSSSPSSSAISSPKSYRSAARKKGAKGGRKKSKHQYPHEDFRQKYCWWQLLNRVFKPVSEHADGRSGGDLRVDCPHCGIISNDQCATTGKNFADLDPVAERQLPKRHYVFDLKLRTNTCVLHGSSEEGVRKLKISVFTMFEKIVPDIVDLMQMAITADPDWQPPPADATATNYFSLPEDTALHNQFGDLVQLAKHPKCVEQPESILIMNLLFEWFMQYQDAFVSSAAASRPARSRQHHPVDTPRSVLHVIDTILLRFALVVQHGTSCQQLLKKEYTTLTNEFPYLVERPEPKNRKRRAAGGGPADEEVDSEETQPSIYDALLKGDNGFLAWAFCYFADALSDVTAEVKAVGCSVFKTKEPSQHIAQGIPKSRHAVHMLNKQISDLFYQTMNALALCTPSFNAVNVRQFPTDFDAEGQLLEDLRPTELLVPVVSEETGMLCRVLVNPDQTADKPGSFWQKVNQVGQSLNNNIEKIKLLCDTVHALHRAEEMMTQFERVAGIQNDVSEARVGNVVNLTTRFDNGINFLARIGAASTTASGAGAAAGAEAPATAPAPAPAPAPATATAPAEAEAAAAAGVVAEDGAEVVCRQKNKKQQDMVKNTKQPKKKTPRSSRYRTRSGASHRN
ncbi:hypothetical protein OAM67_00005 [bacterium]|nr:hypothetical protein [bacterium]